jgi:hypothetical protein
MEQAIQFKLNNRPVRVITDGERELLWVLRADCLPGQRSCHAEPVSVRDQHCGRTRVRVALARRCLLSRLSPKFS